MKRALIVVAASLLGLVGLLMSLCGGGVLLMSGTAPPTEISFVSIALPAFLVGIILVWLSVVILRKKLNGQDRRRDP